MTTRNLTAADHHERRAEPGELCTCGRPAVVVYVTERWGETGYCGREGARDIVPCVFCGSIVPHPARCPKYRLHPLPPAAWPAIVPPLQWNQDFTPSLREPYCARLMTVDGRATWWTVSHCVHCDEWPRDWPTHCAYECPHREDVGDA